MKAQREVRTESEKDKEFVQSGSTCILKSLVMTISDGDERKNSINAGNSWKNVAKLEEGGQYMLKKMICLLAVREDSLRVTF